MVRCFFNACTARLLGLVVLALLSTQCRKREVPPPPETVIATASFADGFTVEVLRAELAETMEFQREAPRSGFQIGVTTESGTYGGAGIDVKWAVRNGSFFSGGMSFQNNSDPVLMLMLRCRKEGVDWENDDFLAEGRRHEVEHSDGRISGLPGFGDTKDELERMALRIQVEDGSGGWRDMVGPVKPAKDDPRAFAGIDAFPRRDPKSKLRFLHLREEPVEITVPNPGYQSTFPAIPLSKLPMVHEDDEFTLRLDAPVWEARPNGKSILKWGERLEYRGVRYQCFDLQTKLYDETGNRLLWSGRNFGLDFLPSEKIGRLVCEVHRRTAIYPWRESEVTIVATGVMGGKVSEQSAVITDEGRALGCTRISFQEPKPRRSHVADGDNATLALIIHGECSQAALKQLQIDYWCSSGIAVFTQDARAAGKCCTDGSSYHSPAVGASSFELGNHWEGQLKTGQAYRIGLIRQQSPKVVQFVQEVPPNPFLARP